jgi:hypothetical protein
MMAEARRPDPMETHGGYLASHLGGDGQLIQVADSLGVIMLGIISIMLLLALLRAQRQVRKLLEQQIKLLQEKS